MSSAFDLLRAVRDMIMPPPPPKLTATDKLVLVALVMRADADGACWPSHARIARDTWLSRRAVKDAIGRLREAGIIDVEPRRCRESNESDTNRYRIRVEVGRETPYVGQETPQVGNDVPQGGAPAARGVGRHVPPGGAPAAYEVPIEVPIGSTQEGEFALTRAEGSSTSKERKVEKRPRHAPEQIEAKTKILDTFCERFLAKKGVKPKDIGTADNAAAFRLAAKFGPEEACAIVRRAFEDDFVITKNATLRYIAGRADTFRGTATKSNGVHRSAFVQPAPPGGSTYRHGDGL